MIYLQMEKLVVDLLSGVERNGAPGLEHPVIKIFVFSLWTGDESFCGSSSSPAARGNQGFQGGYRGVEESP